MTSASLPRQARGWIGLCLLLPLAMFALLTAAPWIGGRALAMGCWLTAALLQALQTRLWSRLEGGHLALRQQRALAAFGRSLIWVAAGYSTAVEPGVIKLWDFFPLGWCAAALLLQADLLDEGHELPKPWVDCLMLAGLVGAAMQQALSAEVAGESVWALKAALILGVGVALGRIFQRLW